MKLGAALGKLKQMQCGPSSAALKCPGCGGAASGRDQCWSLVLVFTLQLTLRLKFPVEGHASINLFHNCFTHDTVHLCPSTQVVLACIWILRFEHM